MLMSSSVVQSAFAAIFLACSDAPPPFGEALLVVQTDVAIPQRVDRLRVDIHGQDGALLESRDVLARRPDEWPISLSVAADADEERVVTVRLRAYPEGHVITRSEREAQALRTPRELASHESIAEACAAAPTLSLGDPVTQRHGSNAITSVVPYERSRGGGLTCTKETRTGSVAAKLVIEESDFYRIEIASAIPDGSRGEPGGNTTLALRAGCEFPTTQIACDDSSNNGNKLAAITAELAPGTYWVVTGGGDRAPADLTLLLTRANSAVPLPLPVAPIGDPAALEPAPGVTIDRLVRVRLIPGQRGTLQIPLFGECLGTSADMATAETCVDRAGVRVPVDTVFTRGRLVRDAPPLASWAGDAIVPCTVAARPPSALLDEEVCIPGGAFAMGDTLALGDLELQSRPERLRVVAPFLLDKFELTVGRFRDAIKRGLVPNGAWIYVNNGPLASSAVGTCTWNQDAVPTEPAPGIDRERHPLNCVSWEQAHAVCMFLGGALPSEDQWEYAANAAGRARETQYPWGDDLPNCDQAVFGRSNETLARGCATGEVGPVPVDAAPWVLRDVTPLGVVGLGGNLEEWLATAFYAYADPVWQRSGLRESLPRWADADAPRRATRGAGWSDFPSYVSSSARNMRAIAGRYFSVGFRCARAGR